MASLSLQRLVICATFSLNLVHCIPSSRPNTDLNRGQDSVQRSLCQNSATNRTCWGEFNIDTDYYETWPTTGVIREYWLTVEQITLSPDGYETEVQVFNGSLPGPTIEADWGDEIVVHVTNNLPDNGTSIHWHGIRQLNNSQNDGVPGVTQCPITPGDTMTYRFQATQYGTSWFHAHLSLQVANGLFGPLVIRGPATANYDVDLGPIMLQDRYHENVWHVWEKYQRVFNILGPFKVVAPNGLINGLNPYDCSASDDTACVGGVTARYNTTFEHGKKYLMRLVGAQTDGYMKFAIDGHSLTVVAADLVPIVPYTTDSVILASGQRYDVIVEADQPVGSYWLRAIYQTACNFNDNDNKDNILGIVYYEGADQAAEPTTKVSDKITNSCGDEDYANLVPWVHHTVGDKDEQNYLDVGWYYDTSLVLHWTMHDGYLSVNWSDPTLLYARNGVAKDDYPDNSNSANIDAPGKWVYWVIQDLTLTNAYHPMHLHGHDFYILAQGRGVFIPGLTPLNKDNPPRRDTATLYGTGFTVIAFKLDNPGAWLLHCHIAWHASQGLAMQLIENQSLIPSVVGRDESQMTARCAAWDSFYYSPAGADYQQDDSGI